MYIYLRVMFFVVSLCVYEESYPSFSGYLQVLNASNEVLVAKNLFITTLQYFDHKGTFGEDACMQPACIPWRSSRSLCSAAVIIASGRHSVCAVFATSMQAMHHWWMHSQKHLSTLPEVDDAYG